MNLKIFYKFYISDTFSLRFIMCSNLRANTLKCIRFLDFFAMVLFFVMCVLILLSYISLTEMAPELQLAANMDYISKFSIYKIIFLYHVLLFSLVLHHWCCFLSSLRHYFHLLRLQLVCSKNQNKSSHNLRTNLHPWTRTISTQIDWRRIRGPHPSHCT